LGSPTGSADELLAGHFDEPGDGHEQFEEG
jgi:hypothetical protein